MRESAIRLSQWGHTMVAVAGHDRPQRQLFVQVLRNEER